MGLVIVELLLFLEHGIQLRVKRNQDALISILPTCMTELSFQGYFAKFDFLNDEPSFVALLITLVH